ncbi:hypothetical protein N665_1684s0011 [Sinapis alba]|nr:hypothetical protein N665_1684s0011 [Sinapis alba]
MIPSPPSRQEHIAKASVELDRTAAPALPRLHPYQASLDVASSSSKHFYGHTSPRKWASVPDQEALSPWVWRFQFAITSSPQPFLNSKVMDCDSFVFMGYTGVFTETVLHTKFHLSCLKSNRSFHLPVGSSGTSLSSFASFLRSAFPPILWRCLSISITVLLSCGAVRSGPEDAAEFVSTNFRGADWMSTSQLKVTISLLSDYVVKATLTHSSTILSSLSFSSFEDLSVLSCVFVVYVFNQRGWIIPSCNQVF